MGVSMLDKLGTLSVLGLVVVAMAAELVEASLLKPHHHYDHKPFPTVVSTRGG